MLRASWASLMARKLRLFMSAAAVILGVAFVAGSFIFTDTLGNSFTAITKSSAGDVVVRGKTSGSGGGDEQASSKTLPASVIRDLAAVPGAARADGNINDYSTFVVTTKNKLIGGQGAPGLAFNHTGGPAAHGVEASRLVTGRWPTADGEVALDSSTAKAAGYRLGDQVKFVSAGSEATFGATLVGTHEMASGSALGASLTVFDTHMAQRLYLKGQDAYNDAWVTADPGISQEQLRAAVARVVPEGFEAVTGDSVSEKMASDITRGLSFVTTFLLVFAAVALIVGTFLIINTFSILVAQRSRELALFRAIGASRRQVTRTVLFEAFVVGLIGGTVGLALGFGLAKLITVLFGQFGLDMSRSPLVLNPRTVIASYAVGLLVTMVAAWLPARRAGLVPPVAAMRDDAVLREGALRKRVLVGLMLAVVGGGLMFVGLRVVHSDELKWLGGGMFGVLIGVALISPLLGRPLVLGLGWLYRKAFGVVGSMATQNSLRNPRRTAATASALMIGVALVTLMSIFGASAKASIDKVIATDLTADYVVSNAIGQSFSPQVAQKVAAVPGVQESVRTRQASVDVDNLGKPSPVWVMGVDPAFVTSVSRLKVLDGSLADFGTAGADGKHAVLLEQSSAKQLGLKVGDTRGWSFQGGETKQFTVAAIYAKNQMVGTAPLFTIDELDSLGVPDKDDSVYVTRAVGASATSVLTGIEAALADLPTVTVKDQAAFAAEQRAPIDQMLTIIYALLGLAVVIAVLGIINTLALSVIERTREIGLLRAVGLSRRQLRSMLRLESVVIALLGATLGVLMGLGFGVAIQRSLAGEGFDTLVVPWTQLLFFLGLAVLVGVLAALWPGRRAAKVDILRAIATE